MDKNKQITEIAEDICRGRAVNKKCDACRSVGGCLYRDIAAHLTAEGYRKASDVAREIVEDAKETILNYHLQENKKYLKGLSKTKKQFDIETACFRAITDAVKFAIATLNEIEKKYIGEDTNVPTNTEGGK